MKSVAFIQLALLALMTLLPRDPPEGAASLLWVAVVGSHMILSLVLCLLVVFAMD